ncbi:hypothetical protein E2C01_019264 [Portunus trituberculatus]|uniref:Uncharacterized protein n=1 Tax=Portunus trituberculatus TaxID=210409 RepID=A0A5B7DWS5_PORTR|nr:hypothetical protein [Portunus trituberculatus]
MNDDFFSHHIASLDSHHILVTKGFHKTGEEEVYGVWKICHIEAGRSAVRHVILNALVVIYDHPGNRGIKVKDSLP